MKTEDPPVESSLAILLERIVAVLSLAALSPLMLLIGLMIKLDSRGPVLYRSNRLGRYARPLTVFKFRSMYVGSEMRFSPDGSTRVDPGDERVTRAGRLIRSGLDELPQLINIARGEMRFIGPRPEAPHALDLMSGHDWLKLAVLPGITGLPAVSGRTDLHINDRFALDAYFVGNRSLPLVAQIAWRTGLIMLGMGQKAELRLSSKNIEEFLSSPTCLSQAEVVRRLIHGS